MFARILYAALIAGVVAGLLVSGVQRLKAVQLIQVAETYEQVAAKQHHEAQSGDWEPAGGLERTAYTVLANILAGIGFALLLGGAFALRGGIDWRRGLLWGLAGFATFALAPALGLPPELPGSDAAPLAARQIWWIGTAVATGGGLWLLVYGPRIPWRVVGALLIALPHTIGAPVHSGHGGLVPADMARDFIAASLIGNLLFWLALGGVSALAFNRIVAPVLKPRA
ncbi:MAG TPA: CbtA family protein [Candidatus Cybelea sp.]|nr:CbtA family protein [Candidatus Cybelea sp.]